MSPSTFFSGHGRHFGAVAQGFAQRSWAPSGHDHEFLDVDVVVGVRSRRSARSSSAAGSKRSPSPPSEAVQGEVRRQRRRHGRRPARPRADRVGSEARLGLRAVELDHRPVESRLRGEAAELHVRSRPRRSSPRTFARPRFRHALARDSGSCIAVAQLQRLAGCRSRRPRAPRPVAKWRPADVVISTSTVGLPRESRISLAFATFWKSSRSRHRTRSPLQRNRAIAIGITTGIAIGRPFRRCFGSSRDRRLASPIFRFVRLCAHRADRQGGLIRRTGAQRFDRIRRREDFGARPRRPRVQNLEASRMSLG